MKILKNIHESHYDFAICGLGFESRSVTAYNTSSGKIKSLIVLGYDENTEYFAYQENKKLFKTKTDRIFEISDKDVITTLLLALQKENLNERKNILIDITVMSRHRLATVMSLLIDKLIPDSTITIAYSLSEFIKSPEGITPVRKVCEIAEGFDGILGDLSLPTSVIIGLGYEQGKALGISNYLDSWRDYLFIPQSAIPEFEKEVRQNNNDLIESIASERVLDYNVNSPYSTYLDLKSLVLSLSDTSRPLLMPLGPKILAALCVVLSKDLGSSVPVWRVSSEYTEEPVDRPPSGNDIGFTIQL